MDTSLEQLARQAQAGNREALEQLVEQIQNKVYMAWRCVCSGTPKTPAMRRRRF